MRAIEAFRHPNYLIALPAFAWSVVRKKTRHALALVVTASSWHCGCSGNRYPLRGSLSYLNLHNGRAWHATSDSAPHASLIAHTAYP